MHRPAKGVCVGAGLHQRHNFTRHRRRNTFCFGGANSAIEMYYRSTREETHSKCKWEFKTLVGYFEENGQ